MMKNKLLDSHQKSLMICTLFILGVVLYMGIENHFSEKGKVKQVQLEKEFNKKYIEKYPDALEVVNKYNQCVLDVSEDRLVVLEGCKDYVLKQEDADGKKKLTAYFLSKGMK